MMKYIPIAGWLYLFLLVAGATAPEQDLIAHYTFDEGTGTVVRDQSGGGNDGKIFNAVFVKSPRGYALSFNGTNSYVDCGANPALNVSGDMTVEAWIKVSPEAKGDKYIFGDNADLAVNRNFYISSSNGRLRIEHGNGVAAEQIITDSEVVDGSWQHIVAVCEYPFYYLYVNGRQVKFGEMTIPIVPTAMTPRRIGGWFWERGYFKGEIDEIRLYRRALSEKTIRRHADGKETDAGAAVQAVIPNLYYPRQELRVKALIQNVATSQTAVITVWGKDQKPVFSRTQALKETRTGSARSVVEATFGTQKLKTGTYRVHVALVDGRGEQKAVSDETTFVYPEKPEWFGSKAGISTTVLPPYTSIKVEKKKDAVSVETWGRRYDFVKNSFLAGVESKGQSLLTGPIRLYAKINGKELLLDSGALPGVRKKSAKTILTWSLSGKEADVTIRAEVEYDGLVKFDWDLKARDAATLEKLTLEIPLDASVARYLYRWPGNGTSCSNGTLTGGTTDLPFQPILWLGDEEKGLSWFAESDRNWFAASPGRAIQVCKGPREVVLRLNLVEQPVLLDPAKPLAYTFGLQATPLKPILKDGWDYRMHHISQSTHGPDTIRLKIPDSMLDTLAAKGVRTICFHEHWTDFQGYSKTPYEADLDSFVKRCHQRGMKVLLYFGFNISDLIPEWPYIGEACVIHPKCGYLPSNYPPQPIQNAYVVCLNSVYQDLIVDGTARLMDRFDIDGVYLDTTISPFACANPLHGCGYKKPDGTLTATYPIFAVRETFKRLYSVIKEREPEGLVDAHVYDCMNAPALAFATSYWTGEQLGGLKLPDGLPLDRFRAECMGYNWGVPAEFLHYMIGGYRPAYSLALLHDILVRSAGLTADFDLESSLWKLMDDFGRKQAVWHPYWKNGDFVQVSPNGCYASFYQHPKNGILLVVSNLKNETAQVRICLQTAKLNMAELINARDALSGKDMQIKEGVITTSLPSTGWQVIWIKPK